MRVLRGVWQVVRFAWEFTAVVVSLMRMPKEPRREDER